MGILVLKSISIPLYWYTGVMTMFTIKKNCDGSSLESFRLFAYPVEEDQER